MTDGQTAGGDCNIPDAFLKKRGDNEGPLLIISSTNTTISCFYFYKDMLIRMLETLAF